jgi:glycosyltransferase involved in cell wall biosynthesis
MRVGFDEQAFLAQRRGGVTRYFVRLVEELRADPGLGADPVLGWSMAPNEHVVEAGLAGPVPLDRGRAEFDPVASGTAYLANLPARLRARRTDLLHYTFYHPRFLLRRSAMPTVTTVHDMIPELYPELFARDPHLHKAAYVRCSDLVLCVSEATRQDLIRIHGDPGVPVVVTHLGVDAAFRPGLDRLPSMPPRYVLFVGRRGGYKDFEVLVEALAQARPADAWLVAVGGGPLSERERELLQKAGLGERWVQVSPSEGELPHWYSCADVFAFPSRYEGFGLPTLEAMASGCPTVLARSSSLPEVGGEACDYFAPGDPADLAEVLVRLWADQELRAARAVAGVARAAEFTWRRTAEATAHAYRLVTGTDGGSGGCNGTRQ